MKKIEHKTNGKEYTKLCSFCKKWLTLDNFHRDKTKADRLFHKCKECRSKKYRDKIETKNTMMGLTAEEWEKVSKLGLDKKNLGGL